MLKLSITMEVDVSWLRRTLEETEWGPGLAKKTAHP